MPKCQVHVRSESDPDTFPPEYLPSQMNKEFLLNHQEKRGRKGAVIRGREAIFSNWAYEIRVHESNPWANPRAGLDFDAAAHASQKFSLIFLGQINTGSHPISQFLDFLLIYATHSLVPLPGRFRADGRETNACVHSSSLILLEDKNV